MITYPSPNCLSSIPVPTTRFTTDTDSLISWAWYKNREFQDILPDPVLFFDSAAVYEIVLQAKTVAGCEVSDTLHYQVLREEMKNPLGFGSVPVMIFPNPSPGIFTINNLENASEVAITDFAGKEIMTFKPDSGTVQVDFW